MLCVVDTVLFDRAMDMMHCHPSLDFDAQCSRFFKNGEYSVDWCTQLCQDDMKGLPVQIR